LIPPVEKTWFDRLRLILRIVGIVLGAVPVICYFIFAFTLSSIHQSYDEVTFQYTITKDLTYKICETSLAIANVTWIYWLPAAFAIGAFDVGVSFYRQFRDS
jgi:ACR3 family arsenite efflux pump ArsB